MCTRPKLAIQNPTGGRPIFVSKAITENDKEQVLQLPCGKCLECRLKHSAEWSTRCVLESRKYRHNQFITLTYADEYLPAGGSVSKKELSDFIKRLRRWYEYNHRVTGIRFFGCGEYGARHLRPHYHLLLFNCPPFGDERVFFRNKLGQDVLVSGILQNKLWKKGICSIGTVTQQSAGYVARYALKKVNSKLPEGLEPEFINMSRGHQGGIGLDYYKANKAEIYRYDEIILNDGVTVKPPKYFDRKVKEEIRASAGYIEVESPYHYADELTEKEFMTMYSMRLEMAEIKREADEVYKNTITLPRKLRALELLKDEMARTGLTEVEIRKNRAITIANRIKALKREWESRKMDKHY